MKRLAIVRFKHGRGCTLGQPYGGCGYECRDEVEQDLGLIRHFKVKRVVKAVQEAIDQEARNGIVEQGSAYRESR